MFVGITINESNLNGKPRCVRYGAEKKMNALKTDGKIIDYDIYKTDDDGNLHYLENELPFSLPITRIKSHLVREWLIRGYQRV